MVVKESPEGVTSSHFKNPRSAFSYLSLMALFHYQYHLNSTRTPLGSARLASLFAPFSIADSTSTIVPGRHSDAAGNDDAVNSDDSLTNQQSAVFSRHILVSPQLAQNLAGGGTKKIQVQLLHCGKPNKREASRAGTV